MNSKEVVMRCDCDWKTFVNIAKKPEFLLYYFPYCKGCALKDNIVHVEFDVKKFIFDFKFDFDIKVEISYPFLRYVMKGKKGTLVIAFKMNEKKKNMVIYVSWEGFGERLMDRQLKEFAEGIRNSLRYIIDEFVHTKFLIKEKKRGGMRVTDIDPTKMPAIVKYFYTTADSRSFVILGAGETGDFFRIYIKDGVVEKCRYIKGNEKFEMKIDKEITELNWEDFKDMKPRGDYFMKIEE